MGVKEYCKKCKKDVRQILLSLDGKIHKWRCPECDTVYEDKY